MANEENGSKLGAPAAQRDHLLKKCFVRSEKIKRVLSFGYPRNLLIGKKGSGKTAIFLVGRGAKSKIATLRISPESHLLNAKGIALNHLQFADILKYEIALECLRVWSKDTNLVAKLSAQEKGAVKAAMGDYFDRLKKLGARVEGASAFGIGLSLGTKADSMLEIVSKKDLKDLMPLLTTLISKGAKCLVLIDDPELLFGYSEDPPANLIGGLLFAAADLSVIAPKSLRVVVLLKLHIYHQIKRRTFEDIDHLRHNFEMLKWTEDRLEELLRLRIQKGLSNSKNGSEITNPWMYLAGGSSKTNAKKLRSHILDRLICGPRDLIWFASLILDSQSASGAAGDVVEAAERKYSLDQLDQVELQYGNRGFRDVSKVLSKLFDPAVNEVPLEMSASEFEDFFRDRLSAEELKKQREKHDWLEAQTPRTLSELLFDMGVLGFWSTLQSKFLLPYDAASDRQGFAASKKWRINPAFYMGLGLVS